MTTYGTTTCRCAICGTENDFRCLKSYSITGTDLDGRSRSTLFEPLDYEVGRCRTCGYCARNISLGKGLRREMLESPGYREILAMPGPGGGTDHWACAHLLSLAGKHAEAAAMYLHAAWIYEDAIGNVDHVMGMISRGETDPDPLGRGIGLEAYTGRLPNSPHLSRVGTVRRKSKMELLEEQPLRDLMPSLETGHVIKRDESPSRICPACGSKNRPNSRFCVACGYRMVDDVPFTEEEHHNKMNDADVGPALESTVNAIKRANLPDWLFRERTPMGLGSFNFRIGISGLGDGYDIDSNEPNIGELQRHMEGARGWLSSTAEHLRRMSLEEFSSADDLCAEDRLVYADVLRRAGRFDEASGQISMVRNDPEAERLLSVIERQEAAVASCERGIVHLRQTRQMSAGLSNGLAGSVDTIPRNYCYPYYDYTEHYLRKMIG